MESLNSSELASHKEGASLRAPQHAIRTVIVPRVSETDGCGHINNTTMPVWFEAGRRELFRAVTPTLEFNDWRLALVSMKVEFLTQTYFAFEVNIETWIAKIGNKSFSVRETLCQNGRITAVGECTYVHFDYTANAAQPIPAAVRERLSAYVDRA
jgi:acyl-CoA thioester hydrolase